jgi:hypothetical protein
MRSYLRALHNVISPVLIPGLIASGILISPNSSIRTSTTLVYDNPSMTENAASVVVVNIVLALIEKPSINTREPLTVPGSILIPGERPIFTLGTSKFTGTVSMPDVPQDMVRSSYSRTGTIKIPGAISCRSVKWPSMSWQSEMGSPWGPVELNDFTIPGPILIPGENPNITTQITVYGMEIAGAVKARGPIRTATTDDGKQIITITGPITIEGPIEIPTIIYFPEHPDTKGPFSINLHNPTSIELKGPFIIEGPITIIGPIRRE